MSNRLSAFIRVVSNRWRGLVGEPSQFTLEARIFHSICISVMVVDFCYIFYDLSAGLYVAAPSCLLFVVLFWYEYHRSRYKHLPHRSLIFGLAGLVVLSVNYFANSGIEGSTDLIWPVYLLLLLTMCRYKHVPIWTIIYLVTFALVHVAEHQYPQWVRYPFSPGHGQFTDRITAFPLPVIGIALVIMVLRRNYDRERATVTQRDAEKGRLLSILSHDLRAPFTQVRQYLELLDDNSLSADERARMEQTLRQANDQTLDLVTNLLYWSRAQLEGVSMRIVPLNLWATLESTLAIAQDQARQKEISFSQNIDSAITINADADMLQLVLRNLLQNAIKFTPSQGSISVEAVSSGRCVLTVSDTGAGIAPERVAALFSGVIAPTYGTANEKGVGLGLQLCRDFMERQGGSISVESKVGEGSRFKIELPIA